MPKNKQVQKVKLENLSEFGKYNRLKFNEYFAMTALIISQRSSCLRKHVGAVIVNNNKIVATGYNGAASGMKQCDEIGCEMRDGHCIRALHAEQNALIQLGNSDEYENLEIYVTDYPCQICAKLIVQANIKAIHFVRDYANDDKFVEELFQESGIRLIKENVGDLFVETE